MRKKAILAALAVSMAVLASACGFHSSEPETIEPVEEEKEEEQAVVYYGLYNGERLVSVKDIDKYLKLGKYKGLELEKAPSGVSDEELQDRLDEILQANAEKAAEGDVTEKGDHIIVNYVGTIDEKTFTGSQANNYDYWIGSGTMVEGFDEAVTGMKKGETKEVVLTIPESFADETSAGKEAVFMITLQNFTKVPELTDKWVKAHTDYKTVDEFKDSIREELKKEKEDNEQSMLEDQAWNLIVSGSEIIEYPQTDMEAFENEYWDQLQVYADFYEMDLEAFIASQNSTMEEQENAAYQYAQSLVKQYLIIQAIMDKENITLDDEECQEIQTELIEEYGMKNMAEMVDTYGVADVDRTVSLYRIIRFALENSSVIETIPEEPATES